MNDDICVLTAHMENDRLVIRDDTGRKIAMVRGISMKQEIRDVAEVTVTFLQARATQDGSPKVTTR